MLATRCGLATVCDVRVMRVEVAETEHIDQWLEMRAGLWPDAPLAEHEQEIAGTLAGTAPDRVGLLAFSDQQSVVGFAEASVRTDPVNGCDTSPVTFLEGIFVKPAHRHEGAARLLLTAVENWGRSKGCTELGSDADCENPEGLAFHAATGFIETERVVFFRKRL